MNSIPQPSGQAAGFGQSGPSGGTVVRQEVGTPGSVVVFVNHAAAPAKPAPDLCTRLRLARKKIELPPLADPDTASFSPTWAEDFLRRKAIA